jgi:hypothetical protein
MQKLWLGIVLMAAFPGGFGVPAVARAADMEDVPLTLSGCVKAGEEKDSFLLSNVEIDGTTLAPVHAFYRFDSTDELKPYVGRRVEVKGKADLDDVDSGKVRVRMHDGKATTEITSERRTLKIDDAWFGSMGSMKIDADIPTYKFDVESVKPLEGNCASSLAAQ